MLHRSKFRLWATEADIGAANLLYFGSIPLKIAIRCRSREDD
jgi:hypothetical protein